MARVEIARAAGKRYQYSKVIDPPRPLLYLQASYLTSAQNVITLKVMDKQKIAIVILADTEEHGDHGRVTNAFELAKEAKEAGDDVVILFDGAGTKWVPEIAKEGSPMNKIYQAVADKVLGACAFCSSAFGVKDQVSAAGVKLVSEYDGHPSLRRLIAEGYSIVTF